MERLAELAARGELRAKQAWPCDHLAMLSARALAALNTHYAADFDAFGFRRAATPAELLVAVRRVGGRLAACSASLPGAPRGCWQPANASLLAVAPTAT